MIELTAEQRRELGGAEPARVIDPQTNETFVLLRTDLYERVRGLLAEGPVAESELPIPAGIRCSQETFWRELPALLANPRLHGYWVAYHKTERLGIARDGRQLVEEINRRHIPGDEYYLTVIRHREVPPWEPEDVEPIHAHHGEEP